MTKNLLDTYKGGFTMYHDSDKNKQYPDEWILNTNRSNEEELHFQAYDANFMPLPNIKDWSQHAIDEVVKKIAIKFKDVPARVYLDGHLLDVKDKRLSAYK